jgi:hypothetical protein
MKKFSTIILILFSISVFAKEVPREIAVKAATFYYKERCSIMGVNLTGEPKISSIYAEMSGSNTLYYVINFEPKGFVVIAADDASTPILGYSLDQNLNKPKASPSLKDWFTIYEESLKLVIKTNAEPTTEAKAEWERITSPTATIKARKLGTVVVGPLLTSTWNQDQYYNALCPYDSSAPTGYDSHVPNGCVALSTSQVMYYNRHPATGTGSHSYTSANYGTLSANYGSTTYNWNAMTDVVINYNTNVAKLIYHLGVAVNMDYAAEGSGSQTSYAAQALKQYFGYSSTCTLKYKASYPVLANWIALFKDQLNAKHPMINSGSSTASGGHAYNCDGYDDQDYFHFNWGWAGEGNGYFLLSNLNPIGSDFNQYQDAIINIFPQTAPAACSSSTTLTGRTGSIEDGSRSANYANDLDCQWLVSPEDATSITFTFSRLNTEAGADSITFYSGETTSDSIYATFSGTTLPASFTITSPNVLVRFKTNSSVQNDGWLVNYTSSVSTAYCTAVKVMATQTGTITDGSSTNKYHNNTFCKWLIQPTNATSVTLTFVDFDLSTDDQVLVFNRINTTHPILLNTYTGSSLPSIVYCPSGKLAVYFQADNINVGGGFTANYTSEITGVNEINGVSNISLYPNPASTSLQIKMQLDEQFEGTISIVDISGRVVYSTSVSSNAGLYTDQIDLSTIASGLYLINFKENNGQKITLKFAKQ